MLYGGTSLMQQQASKDKSLLDSLLEERGKEKGKDSSFNGIVTPDGGSLALAIRTGTIHYKKGLTTQGSTVLKESL